MEDRLLLQRLGQLVACDTQNPPREITGDSAIFGHCREALGAGFEVRTWDHGDGHVSWYAVRGRPHILFNVHLDTVPIGEGWTSDPLKLEIKDGLAFGRGTCDIKGAAAALLSLAEEGAENLALLFTSDEEGAGGCCVERFLQTGEADRFEQVVVAEPTECQAVTAHRGFLSVKTRFHGVPGHSSEARALSDNANHQMAAWAAKALAVAHQRKSTEQDPGSCMNIGVIQGGTKSNVIAGESFVHWSARLAPGDSNKDFLEEIKACTPADQVDWEVPFAGEPLPATGQDARTAEGFCRDLSIPVGAPVDFWTEASLFSAAGLPAVVLGPGSIRQAHATDEWVALEQLARVKKLYKSLVSSDG